MNSTSMANSAVQQRSAVRWCVELEREGVRLAQKIQVGPCIPVGKQLKKAKVCPTSGSTWRVSYLVHDHRASSRAVLGPRCHALAHSVEARRVAHTVH
jgi:hypothetical protein